MTVNDDAIAGFAVLAVAALRLGAVGLPFAEVAGFLAVERGVAAPAVTVFGLLWALGLDAVRAGALFRGAALDFARAVDFMAESFPTKSGVS